MTEPVPPDSTLSRLSDRPFPPYRFVPGLNAHPVNHPLGHSYRAVEPDVSAEAAALISDWRASPQFRFGVDLYNFAYWWEAHEAWEALWHKFGKDDPYRHAIQVLIQTSAAHLKLHMQQPRGVRSLLESAGKHLERALTAGPIIFGVPLQLWWDTCVLPYFELPAGREFPFLRPQSTVS